MMVAMGKRRSKISEFNEENYKDQNDGGGEDEQREKGSPHLKTSASTAFIPAGSSTAYARSPLSMRRVRPIW